MKLARLAQWLITGGALILASGVLISCTPDTSAPEFQPRLRATNTAPAQNTPDALPVRQVAFTDSACLKCHTDENQLRSLAKEKEVVAAESEGPG